MQYDLDGVLQDYEASKRLQTLVSNFWDSYTSIVKGPRVLKPSSWAKDAWEYKYVYTSHRMNTKHRYVHWYEHDGEVVRLESIDVEKSTFTVWYPSECEYEPSWGAGTEEFPLEWLYTDGWKAALEAELAQAWEDGQREGIKKAEAAERARYEELKRKFGS